jgi:chemotaxis protein MotB
MSDASLSHIDPHSEEEENYFISMTDMMVGVLFVFIILLMVFAANFRQQTETSEDQIKLLKQAAEVARRVAEDVSDLRKRVTAEITVLNQSDEVRTRLLQEIRDELREQGLNVTIDPESGVVRLGENAINFDLGSADLTSDAARRVDILASVLATVLPRYATRDTGQTARIETVFIEGHTDPAGLDENNWRLSTARAVNTFRRLTASNSTLRALRNDQDTEILSVAGYAATRQIEGVPNDSQRRIDLRFVMSTDSMERLKDVLRLTNSMQDQLDSLRTQLDKVSGD